MKPVDRTAKGQTETLVFELTLAHSPAKVWRALTEPALLAEWLLPAVGFGLAPGTEFTLQTAPVGGWDGVVRCRLLEVEAPRRIAYAWVVGDLDTVVTFTLEPAPAGSRLTIAQSGFGPAQKQNFGGARYGWNLMGGELFELLARTP